MKDIIFKSYPIQLDSTDTHIVYITKVKDKLDLLNKLAEALNFPDYFGKNWDALYDCLAYPDESIKEHNIVIVHEDVSALSTEELTTYIHIIYDTAEEWKNDMEHHYQFIFSTKEQYKIEKICINYMNKN